MKKPLLLLLFLLCSFLFSVSAAYATVIVSQPTISEVLSNFKSVQEISPLSISVPTLAEMPVDESSSDQFAILEVESNKLQPFIITTNKIAVPYYIQHVEGDSILREDGALLDNDYATHTDFYLSVDAEKNNAESTVTLDISYNAPITSSAFVFELAANSVRPHSITVERVETTQYGTSSTIILYQQLLQSGRVAFPIATSDHFKVTFYYTQPFRLTEVGFEQTDNTIEKNFYMKFLTRPNMTYKIYSHPDRANSLSMPESGNLNRTDTIVVNITPPPTTSNPIYRRPDSDNDGLVDTQDNCPSTPNPDQKNINNNNRGDACEDFDLDGVMNTVDNCPEDPNRFQTDEDSDGYGDHCDPEESRLTERLWWLPWLGIGIGFTIVFGLLYATTRKPLPLGSLVDKGKNRS